MAKNDILAEITFFVFPDFVLHLESFTAWTQTIREEGSRCTLYGKFMFILYISDMYSFKFNFFNVEPVKVQLTWAIQFL